MGYTNNMPHLRHRNNYPQLLKAFLFIREQQDGGSLTNIIA